jgi:hypothetical protein
MSDEKGGSERRKFKRYHVIAQVELSASDDVVFLQMENLSRGGALFSVTAKELPTFGIGDEVSAFLDLGSDEAGENLSVSLDASIVRLVERGPRDAPAIAVEWTRLSPLCEAGLNKIIQYVAAGAQEAPL